MPISAILASSCSIYSLPEVGGTSRPSMKQWTLTSLTPQRFAISSRPYRWVMWLWTPPSESSPIRCSARPSAAAFFIASTSASFSKKSPSSMLLVIRVSS